MQTEQEQETAAPQLGTPEYDAAMIKKAEEAEQEQEGTTDETQPELPEGVTIQDLLALHAKSQEEGQEDQQEEGGEEEGEEEGEGEEAQEEVSESDARIAALEAKLKEAEDREVTQKVYDTVGGKESYDALLSQAETQLTDAQAKLVNTALTEGTAEEAVAAAQMLQTFLGAGQLQEGQMVQGGHTAPATDRFHSEADLHAAISDPLYNQMTPAGEAYRQSVEQRLARSTY